MDLKKLSFDMVYDHLEWRNGIYNLTPFWDKLEEEEEEEELFGYNVSQNYFDIIFFPINCRFAY